MFKQGQLSRSLNPDLLATGSQFIALLLFVGPPESESSSSTCPWSSCSLYLPDDCCSGLLPRSNRMLKVGLSSLTVFQDLQSRSNELVGNAAGTQGVSCWYYVPAVCLLTGQASVQLAIVLQDNKIANQIKARMFFKG